MLKKKYFTRKNIMNWYKTVKYEKKLEEIASDILKKNLEYYDDENLRALCLPISRELKQELVKYGYNAIIVQGTFNIDEPNPEYYEDIDEEDDNYEQILYNPLHYWVEVNGIIIDITAKQFEDEVMSDDIQPITIGTYDELPRYNPIRRNWK